MLHSYHNHTYLCNHADGTPREYIEKAIQSGIKTFGFSDHVLDYVALSDLFVGKAGANAMAEAAYFGLPIMITKCATYIEKHTRNYYTKKRKCALYVPSAYFASKQIIRFAKKRDLLSPYKKNIAPLTGASGEELAADILYNYIMQ